MTYKHSRGKILILIISVCFSFLSKAQITNKDSVINKQEIVKYIAYGAQPAWMVTSSISTVSGSELQKSFASNLANTLYGRLAGLTVRQGSGEAGADSPNLNCRGLNTFGTGRSLLIIVDGYESPMEQMTPEEIESVTLLKDASATALYGSRAANGVLLITTRRGKEGPMVINFRTQQGIQNGQHLPDFLGSYDYARLLNEGLINDGKAPRYTADDLSVYQTGSDPVFYPDVNWYDELLRKSSYVSSYGLDFRGGSSNIRYFALLNVQNIDGLYKKTGDLSEFSKNATFKKYNIRTNVDIDLNKRMTVSFDLGVAITDKANPAADNTNSIFNLMSKVPPNAFPVYNPNNTFGGNSLYSNPLGDVLQTGFYESNARTLQSALKFTEQLDMITQGLSASAGISFNNFFRGYSSKSRTYDRYSLSKDASGNTIYTQIGAKTSLAGNESKYDQWRNFTFQTIFNYDRTFGNSKVDALMMFNLDNYILSGNNLPFKHIGVSSRITYSNSEKYIAEFSFGYNGSENFKKGNRFGFFPAISVGWIASNEDFLKGSSIINYLKIRGSYGEVGNDIIGGDRFMFDQVYAITSSYYLGSTNAALTGIEEGTIANPDVTWEKEKKINFGFEATILKQLEVSLDLFSQDRSDILAKPNQTVPQFLGLSLPNLNVGKVNNKGFEAMIGYNSNQAKNLQFFVNFSLWYAKSKIVYNSETIQLQEYLNKTGRSIDQPFLLEAIGFFKDQADITSSPKQLFTTVQPGDIKYKDQNDDNIINQLDYYPVGNPSLPELTAGLHTGLKYKGFDLDVFFQGIANCSVYLTGNDFYAFQNNGKISSIALGRWTPETAGIATYPRLSAQNNLNNFQPSSFWQRNGSFIKLRSIELGYNLSKKVTERIRVADARLFINGTNLLSWDHVEIADPETLTGYPSVSTFNIGTKIQF